MLGGILGLAISVISITLVPFMAGVMGYGYGVMWWYGGMMMNRYGMFGYPQVGLDMVPVVMAIWSLFRLIGGSLAVYCAVKLRSGYTMNVIFVGVIGGIFLLLSFSWLASILVLAGSILLYFA